MKAKHIEAATAYLFLLPNFLGFLIFTSLPVLASLFLSFMDAQLVPWPKVLSAHFIGFANFIKLLGFHCQDGVMAANDPKFWQFAGNTLFLMMVIPIQIFSSLALAIIMNQKLKGITVFRTIYFLPTISNGVAICLLWQWIYNPNFGLLNSMIMNIGSMFGYDWQGPLWLSSVKWAKPSLMIMSLWVAIGGYNTILYLAALQNIPKDYYEAAEIDGANSWQKFWSVTWPMISPTTFFITIMGVIWGFQGGFEQAYIMTRGGPNGATTTLEYYIYNNLYEWHHVGYAASIAWFLFIIIFIITIINWRFGGKLVQY
ncbi:MAG: sugar ABC transporter permease [Candidatus Omnitrophica bacterium]|nr:sugar ABC transporter permease [Candidatus Omnitrophota bacterium]